MTPIKTLDPHTILKLAAGEIIDRPVSIVKELIENALDANATTIAIQLKQGGIADISVQDDGDGIATADMMKTIEPHATSKLTSFDDLTHVLTMGFRGEALASMSAVADVSIHSYNGQDEIGQWLNKPVGADPVIEPKACPRGTLIRVSHLFKKVPVRFRFLKSPSTEASYISRLVQQFAMHYPERSFSLHNNGVDIVSVSGMPTMKDRFGHIVSVSGDQVISFHKQHDDITVSGVITTPTVTFKQRTRYWFSVNGRMVKSPLFIKAVDAALADSVPKGRYPAIVCAIQCEGRDVDINIHPKKEDVKFSNNDAIFLTIKRAIQMAMHQPVSQWKQALTTMVSEPDHDGGSPRTHRHHPPFVSSPVSHAKSSQSSQSSVSPPLSHAESSQSSHPIHPKSSPSPLPFSDIATPWPKESSPLSSDREWLSFHDKYIVVSLGSELLIFDQHAVHERVLYDRLVADMAHHTMPSTPLLIPESIPISSGEADRWREAVPVCQSMGMDMDVVGDDTLCIRAIPSTLSRDTVASWVQAWSEDDDPPDWAALTRDEQIKQWQMRACKAAVKSGQRLHKKEVVALIESIMASDQQHTCPHGRPLYITLNESRLDTLFLRS